MVTPKFPFLLVSLVCKIFLSNIVQTEKLLRRQRRWSLAFLGPVNSNGRTQIEIKKRSGEMFAYQNPTYPTSTSAVPAELWRLVAISSWPFNSGLSRGLFSNWVPNFFWFVEFLNVFSVQTRLCARWTNWWIAEASLMRTPIKCRFRWGITSEI